MVSKIVGVFKKITLKRSGWGHFDGRKSSVAIRTRSGVALSKREIKVAGDAVGSQTTSPMLRIAWKRCCRIDDSVHGKTLRGEYGAS
jgi:hypothetical protein